MKNGGIILASGVIIILAFWIGLQVTDRIVDNDSTPVTVSESTDSMGDLGGAKFDPPSMDDVPEGPLGESIKYGKKIMDETSTVLDGYVGNKLSCSSCHAGAGTNEKALSLVGVTAAYPQYRPREAEVRTIEGRLNGCMLRSMNGKELPLDSKEMKGLVSYVTYISQGIKVGDEVPWIGNISMEKVPVPDVAEGEKLYKKSCVTCHAQDGQGTDPINGPALWGPDSFNDGAGLSRLAKIAGFIQTNMPVGQEGTLSDQEAANLGAYILSHDRPVWKHKDKDWPDGGKPNDVMDQERREQVKNGTIKWEDVVKSDKQ